MMRRILFQKIALAAIAMLLIGCSPTIASAKLHGSRASLPTPTLLEDGPVIIKQSPFDPLDGTIYGHGKIAVLLASQGGQGESEWTAFAQVLAGEGFTALTVSSQDDEGATAVNVGYAIDFLHLNGFDKILCIGAGNGAGGCASNATQPEIIGLVLITYPGGADLTNVALPKLFITGEEDTADRPKTEAGYQAAAEPKALILVPGTAATGSTLLDASVDSDLQATVVDFVEQCTGQQ
ncbi:MAG TPA: hypothetical protein VMC09_00505 [Anaerolineales bacterium]|nr:hypothetical protein [Anaerolineales bacterium]